MTSKFLRTICKSTIDQVHIRNFSSELTNTTERPGRVVFISQTNDIYSNLAFEDWLYKNWDFSKRHILFLWRNSPCVVIGRHQNPFSEANIEYLNSAGVPVVRRNSGGGTVYHDDGNLNCTFFTSKQRYNRRTNLNLICKALNKDFNIASEINKKDDIVVSNELKVSGTAAKLGRISAYHHCTLLVSSDKTQLRLALKGDKTLKSKATRSISSSVANLQDFASDLTVEKLLASIGKNYLLNSEKNENDESTYTRSDGFTLINPTEEWFPGLDAIKANLKSWDWFVGMTPLFKQTRPVTIDSSFSEGSTVLISIEAFHGVIKSIMVESSVDQVLKDLIENRIGKSFIGARYSPDLFFDIESRLVEKELNPHFYTVR